MRSIGRSVLVAMLVAQLLNVPSFAANEKALGQVVQAQDAQIGEAKVTVGTTIYPGDSVATSVGGALRLRLGTSQAYLFSSSAATLAEDAGAIRAVVTRGTVGFSSNGKDQFELEIPEGILRAANGQPVYGQVTIAGPQEVVISAYKNDLVLDNDGELHTIAAGKSYRVTMDEDPATAAGDEQTVSPKKRRRRRLAFVLILSGAMALAGGIVWNQLSESPSKPN
jgi:hypothetical protein